MAGVLAFHAGFGWASGGYLGVSTFFTLSGFLITKILVAEWESRGRIDLLHFWTRRARRLMPAAFVGLMIIALFGVFAADPVQLARLRSDGLGALLYVANWRLLYSGQSYAELFSSASPITHLWSLAIEEQFYLLYPLLLLVLLRGVRGGRRALMASLAVLACASALWMAWLYSSAGDPSRVYYGTDTRAAELLVGAVLAVALGHRAGARSPLLSTLGIAALGVTLAVWWRATPHASWLYEGGFFGYALVSALLVAASLAPGPASSLLSLAPLRWLGRISYGVYVYHWPIYLWLDADRTGLDPWPLFGLRILVTLALAALSSQVIERPVRHGRGRGSGDRTFWTGSVLAATAVAAGFVAVTPTQPVPDFLYEGRFKAKAMPHRRDDRVRILVLGDSVAWSLGHGLEAWGESTGRASVWNLGTLRCGIARSRGLPPAVAVEATDERCDTWSGWWGGALRDFDPDLIVLLTGIWDLTDRVQRDGTIVTPGDPAYDRWLVSEYSEAVELLSVQGAGVLWLTTPCARPPSFIGALAHNSGAAPERIRHLNEEVVPTVLAARSGVMEVYDLYADLCPTGEFQRGLGGFENLRPDGLHFSGEGSAWFAARLGPRVVEAADSRRSQRGAAWF